MCLSCGGVGGATYGSWTRVGRVVWCYVCLSCES